MSSSTGDCDLELRQLDWCTSRGGRWLPRRHPFIDGRLHRRRPWAIHRGLRLAAAAHTLIYLPLIGTEPTERSHRACPHRVRLRGLPPRRGTVRLELGVVGCYSRGVIFYRCPLLEPPSARTPSGENDGAVRGQRWTSSARFRRSCRSRVRSCHGSTSNAPKRQRRARRSTRLLAAAADRLGAGLTDVTD